MSEARREGTRFRRILILGTFVDENPWFLVGVGVSGMISVGLSFLRKQPSSGGLGVGIPALELLILVSVLFGIGLSLWALITYTSRSQETLRELLTFVTGRGVLIALFLISFNLLTVTSVLLPLTRSEVIPIVGTQFLITGSLLVLGVANTLSH